MYVHCCTENLPQQVIICVYISLCVCVTRFYWIYGFFSIFRFQLSDLWKFHFILIFFLLSFFFLIYDLDYCVIVRSAHFINVHLIFCPGFTSLSLAHCSSLKVQTMPWKNQRRYLVKIFSNFLLLQSFYNFWKIIICVKFNSINHWSFDSTFQTNGSWVASAEISFKVWWGLFWEIMWRRIFVKLF